MTQDPIHFPPLYPLLLYLSVEIPFNKKATNDEKAHTSSGASAMGLCWLTLSTP